MQGSRVVPKTEVNPDRSKEEDLGVASASKTHLLQGFKHLYTFVGLFDQEVGGTEEKLTCVLQQLSFMAGKP